MAEVVGVVCLAHSPLWNLRPDPPAGEVGAAFVSSVEVARAIVGSLRPDAVVVFGPDHARGLFYDVMPPFTIGTERVVGVGDYHTPGGDLPLAGDLARSIFEGVTQQGFDPALSLAMRIDHGLAQTYGRLIPDLDVPIVPIIVNCGCPPLPSFRRCHDFGAAVGRAIAASPVQGRVVAIGSGGMSHWPASIDAFDPAITPEWRDFLINGRSQVAEMEPARVAKAEALAAAGTEGRINDAWDHELLDRLLADPTSLGAYDDENVTAVAGPGADELRAWAAAIACWGGALTWTAYEAVPIWITGMGAVASAAPPASARS